MLLLDADRANDFVSLAVPVNGTCPRTRVLPVRGPAVRSAVCSAVGG